MKKTPLKRKSKSPIRKLQDELWEQCRRIIKERYGNVCYTCKKGPLEGSNWQIGHFIPKAACGAYLKYDLRNLRPQCFHCNINHSGNGSMFYHNLRQDEGQEFVDKLFQDKQITVKSTDHYTKLLDEYSKL
jgi:tRNA G26 N,N-dimethylase Trm1